MIRASVSGTAYSIATALPTTGRLPVRATIQLATNPTGQWGGHVGARCDRCKHTTYSGVRRVPDGRETIWIVKCTYCAKLFDATE